MIVKNDPKNFIVLSSIAGFSYSKNPKRTIENISANIQLVKSITNNKPVPLLIYLCKSPVPDKATQQFAKEQLAAVYTAMAMVSKPGLAQFIMKLLFKFQQPPIPIQSFTDVEAAKAWLQQFK
jgi:hypothetical protein